MNTAYSIARAVFINTAVDVLLISVGLYLLGEFAWENLLFGWLALLAVRILLGFRTMLLLFVEHWLFRNERVERLTAALRLANVPRDYETLSEFEPLSQLVLQDTDAGAKAKQLMAELVGYAQCAAETSTLRGILFRLTLDSAVRRYLA